MKSTATWGVVQTPDKLLWARLVDRNARVFESSLKVITGGEQAVVAALSAVDMALRKTTLPFTQHEQIWAVLPQEAMETLIARFNDPCYALQWKTAKSADADVFFALCERQALDGLLTQLATTEIQPIGVVMAELGAWPLLETTTLLPQQSTTLVVDGSANPPSVYSIIQGRLHDFRLVAPATIALGNTAITDEIQWLTTDLLNRLPDKNPAEIKMVFLGQSPEFWHPITTLYAEIQCEIPTLTALGEGLRDWEWVRPAGLALAAAQGTHNRLMDFLNGAGEQQWQTWLRPWRQTAILMLILLLAWGGQTLVRLTQAQAQFTELKTQTDAIFRDALPTIPVIVEPVLQLKQALGQANVNKEGEFPNLGHWIRVIQTAIPADTQVKWLRLRYEPGEIQLSGEVPSYQHLDKLRSALQQLSGGRETRMDEARIIAETKTVRFRLGLL